MQIKVGCCGFPMNKAKYFDEFEVVELQQTFYQPPKVGTVARWKDSVPVGFEFTLKAWQLITHEPSSPTYRRAKVEIPADKRGHYGFFKPTEEVFEAWERTKEIALALGAKILVFQCPGSFKPTDENIGNMREFFNRIKSDDFIFAWEPRGRWEEEIIIKLCWELDLVHCVDPFKDDVLYGDIKYFRLHGIKGYSYKYTDEDLVALFSKCKGADLIYCMFNNVSMAEDARRFKRLILGN